MMKNKYNNQTWTINDNRSGPVKSDICPRAVYSLLWRFLFDAPFAPSATTR